MPRLHEVLVSPLVGGAGIVAIRLAEAAVRRGVPCTAWVPGAGPAGAELDAAHVPWRTYDLEGMKAGALAHILACARISPGLIGRTRPLVHVHNPTVYRLLRPALVMARARVIAHFQIEPSADDIRWTMEFPPDYVVACAEYIADTIRRVKPGIANRVLAIPNAIDIERFFPRPDSSPRPIASSCDYVILMMANLAPHKGQLTAIRALKELTTRGVSAECWLAGEDRTGSNFGDELRALASELGIKERVKFLGFRSDGPDLLRSADVLLLPSTHEGLPLTVLEAQAAGVPVVGSTIPGVREAIEDGVTGFTVDASDSSGYSDRIATLLTNPTLRETITNAARKRIHERYNWASFEHQLFELYSVMSTGDDRLRSRESAVG